jgi:hypothetical protein
VKIKIIFADWTMKKSTEEDIKSAFTGKNMK